MLSTTRLRIGIALTREPMSSTIYPATGEGWRPSFVVQDTLLLTFRPVSLRHEIPMAPTSVAHCGPFRSPLGRLCNPKRWRQAHPPLYESLLKYSKVCERHFNTEQAAAPISPLPKLQIRLTTFSIRQDYSDKYSR